VGQLKTDEPEIKTTTPQTLRVNTEAPTGLDSIVSVGQKSEIRKEMNDFVQGNLDYTTISQVSKDDITKMSQIQKLRENETGLKVLEEKAKAEKDLIEVEKKLKELALKEKELDIKLKQEKGNVEVQKEKADLKRIKAETTKARLDIIWKLKWWIIGGVVVIFGYKAAWPYIKSVIVGKSVFSGAGSSTPTNSNKGALD
jgi:copper chaperone CopZ